MKIPKIKQKLKSFILDEQASLTKKSVIGIGLLSFSLATLHSSEAARCVCSPECSCVGYTPPSCGCDGYVPCSCESDVGGCGSEGGGCICQTGEGGGCICQTGEGGGCICQTGEGGGCSCVDVCGYLEDGALPCPTDGVSPCPADPPPCNTEGIIICTTEGPCLALIGSCNLDSPCWCETECTQTCVTLGCELHSGPQPCMAYCPSYSGTGGGY